ncbi:hypothetical protein BCR35DRAFT_349457 [Leucosporidium creatinivorum]|uniref:Peptidase M43 pregnancy-associated plasma-A domain-containing protein n=1 Tax=Leucosporidium creatinivorum TaxID=106004 RepID=A0A1Y2G3Y2_9BASI|nr:hypothetical protein BCR35DRAFT_349457 [Leucosporidium creatinivorum]
MRFSFILGLLPVVLGAAATSPDTTEAPPSLNFGQTGVAPPTKPTFPPTTHPYHGDSPSSNLWTPAQKASFQQAVASWDGKEVTTKGCAVYADQTITIPVFVVVHYYSNPISNDKTRAHGYLSPAQVQAMIDQMNKDWSASKPRVRFALSTGTGANAGIRYVVFRKIADWNNFIVAPPSNQAELDVVTTIAENVRGPVSSRPSSQMRQLFIYTVKAMPDSTIAFAFLPSSSSPFSVDGIYISQEYLLKPASDLAYHYPHTLTHEAGHWLTLEHTFEGGCDAPNTLTGGDMVTDTPRWDLSSNFYSNACYYYKQYGYDFNKIVNPCPGGTKAQAIANIANYMSYSLAECTTKFTTGQQKRAWAAAINFRKFVPVCGAVA